MPAQIGPSTQAAVFRPRVSSTQKPASAYRYRSPNPTSVASSTAAATAAHRSGSRGSTSGNTSAPTANVGTLRKQNANAARPRSCASHQAVRLAGRSRSIATSPSRMRSPRSSGGPNIAAGPIMACARNTCVTASPASKPLMCGRAWKTASITIALMSPKTLFVNTPAAVAARYVE